MFSSVISSAIENNRFNLQMWVVVSDWGGVTAFEHMVKVSNTKRQCLLSISPTTSLTTYSNSCSSKFRVDLSQSLQNHLERRNSKGSASGRNEPVL